MTTPRFRDWIESLPEQGMVEIAALAARMDDVIPLWYGESDLPTPAFIRHAAIAALADNQTFYPPMSGIAPLREAIAGYLNSLYRTDLPSQRICVTPSGMQAMWLAFAALLEPGDKVVVLAPVWPNIPGAIHLAGGRTVFIPMDSADGWSLDLGRLEEALKSGVRALFIASPNNPNGWIMSADEQRQVLEICRRHQVWLVADDVYGRLSFESDPAPAFIRQAREDDRIIVINSFSKAWAMTGWRIGWLVHPPGRERLFEHLSLYANSGTATFVQYGALAALKDGEPAVTEMRAHCRRGRDIVCPALEAFPRVRLPERPRGALYVFFEVDGMTDSRAFSRDLLQKTGVGLAPGGNFGPGFDSFLRLSCCLDGQKLAEAMDRLAPALG